MTKTETYFKISNPGHFWDLTVVSKCRGRQMDRSTFFIRFFYTCTCRVQQYLSNKRYFITDQDNIKWLLFQLNRVKMTTIAVVDPGFSPGAGPTSKTYYFPIFSLKTAWKWKNLDPGGDVPGALLDPPMDWKSESQNRKYSLCLSVSLSLQKELAGHHDQVLVYLPSPT